MHPGLLIMVSQISELGVRKDMDALTREQTDALPCMLSTACDADLTDQEVPGCIRTLNPPGEAGQRAQDVTRLQTGSDDCRDIMDTAANQLGTGE